MRTIRPKTEVDGDKMLEYCSKMGLNVDLFEGCYSQPRITYEAFEHWVESGLPMLGSVIVYERYFTIGIVSSADEKTVLLGTALLGEDGLVVSGVERPVVDFRYATEDEIIKLHQVLTRKGFTWNLWRNKFTKSKFSPRPNLFVRFRSYIDDDYGVGVFREINTEGKLVMYCAVCNDGQARFSLYEVIGDANRYQLASANRNDIAQLKKELGKAGKVWNGHYNRIEPSTFFINYGEKYYYINDKGEIKSATKNDSYAYRKRLACGNHFLNIEHAEDLKEKVCEYRKLQLSSRDFDTDKPR